MDFGNGYADKHADALNFIRENCGNINLVNLSWTSDPTPWGGPANVYNCFGCVLGLDGFWQPPSVWGDTEGDPRFPWPENLLDESDIAHNCWISRYVAAAEVYGFKECESDPSFEPDFDKIVLMHKGGIFKHAATQVGHDRWKSKLGLYSDCEHPLELFAACFGKGRVFMKRPRSGQTPKTSTAVQSAAGAVAESPNASSSPLSSASGEEKSN
jgi:hypothetical protein